MVSSVLSFIRDNISTINNCGILSMPSVVCLSAFFACNHVYIQSVVC